MMRKYKRNNKCENVYSYRDTSLLDNVIIEYCYMRVKNR